jgi:hypothetical protein
MTKRKAKAAVIARKELTATFRVSPYLQLEQIQLPDGEWVTAGPDNKPLDGR